MIAGLSIGRDSEPLWLTPSQWAGTIVFVAVSASIAVFGGELRATFERAASGSEAFSIGNEAVLFLQEAGGGVILGLLIGWISDKSADGYVRALWCRKCQPR